MSIQFSPVSTIAFIDAGIADYQSLALGLLPGVEVVVLDPTQDGVQQITDALNGRSDLSSVQILSHGAPGSLQLGSTQLDSGNLDRYADQLQQWKSSLSDTADILLYGCDLSADGNQFIDRLSHLTGADVAASINPTGNAALGGDWNLEATTGSIEAGSAIKLSTQASYQGLLGKVITVTSSADSGAGSLRAAIGMAQSVDTIRFATSLNNQTIKLTSGQIEIPANKNLTIDGAGANLTISGNNASRIFLLNSTSATPTSLTVQNLTLTNGYTNDRGGAISTTHQGVLTVDNVTFNNNVADKGGGAVFSAFEGTLTVTNSRFNGNVATAGNDERGAGAIAFWGPRAFTIRNSDFVGNKGINGGAVNSLNGKLTIDNSRFINNDTTAAKFDTGKPNDFLRGFGGALYTDRASATTEASGTIQITNSTFEGNKGRSEGGAAYLFTGAQDNVVISGSQFKDNVVSGLTGAKDDGALGGGVAVLSDAPNKGLAIERSSFINNTANSQGGGLWMRNAPATITNSTFSGNKTLGSDFNRVGGGMVLYGPATLLNNTIANNSAGWVAGGVLADKAFKVTAKNTIFYNNTAANGGNDWKIQQQTNRALDDGGGNIQFPNLLSNQFNRFNDSTATANIRIADPKLGALQNNGGGLLTYALLPGSPALDAGVSGAPAIDERGVQRDSKPDVGAVEGVSTGSSPSPSPILSPAPSGSKTLMGRDGKKDVLVGSAGGDVLVGLGGSDLLTGKGGADRFVYTGSSQRRALAGSLARSPDRIADFNFSQGDRFQLDYNGSLATIDRPSGLFNAGAVKGNNLAGAAKAAYADKNRKRSGKQALQGNEALVFGWKGRTYLSVNNGSTAFNPTGDLIANITGAKMRSGDAAAGVLSVGNYFA